jgi:HSP20 family protein|tara:strand:- start:321 stop:806 length:486 start_codon:yes stop_codon:yes gene_type:complete
MTKLKVYNHFPVKHFNRDEFLTPFDRIFDDFFRSSFPGLSKDFGEDFFSKGSYPKVNVVDNADSIVIEAAVPGLTKKDVQVEIQDNVLTIKAESNQNSAVENSQYVKREIKRSAFQRSFNLGENLDQEKITGECENGVLALTIPKVIPEEKEKKVRTIDIL